MRQKLTRINDIDCSSMVINVMATQTEKPENKLFDCFVTQEEFFYKTIDLGVCTLIEVRSNKQERVWAYTPEDFKTFKERNPSAKFTEE